MSLFCIATIFDKERMIGLRLLDTENCKTIDTPVENAVTVISDNNNVKVENLCVRDKELFGVKGPLSRYTKVDLGSNLHISVPAVVVIGELENKEVDVADYKGNITRINKAELMAQVKNKELHVANNESLVVESGERERDIITDRKKAGEEVGEVGEVARMRELSSKLTEYAEAYYNGKEEISDYEFDKIYDELLELESNTGIVIAGSYSQKVGADIVSKLEKVEHESKMLSLDKTKEISELKAFIGDKEGILSWKMDGLTIVLTYIDGELNKAVTRGNGYVGELVTNNAKKFINLPLRIPFKGKLVLRGEAVIGYSDFNKINDEISDYQEKYKNPRNLCSGSVRQLDSSVTEKRKVQLHVFNVVSADGFESNSVEEQLQFAKSLGFSTVDYEKVTRDNIEQAVYEFKNKIGFYGIPSDGLVLTFNDIAYGKSLGTTSKFPRHSIAFKWKDETEKTRIKYIEWSPSKTGLLNPVAVFEPVDIEGSTVSRASVHNVSIMKQLELGYGDEVEVYKANMIIPQIARNNTCSDTCDIPSECPVCGGETEIRVDGKSGVYTLYCTNPDCPAKGNKKFKHFVSRDAMNIRGLSEQTLVKLIDEGMISTFADIYRIERYKDEIVMMEGFGYKSYENMIEAINESRRVKVSNLLNALSIPNVGLATAKLICKSCGGKFKDTIMITYDKLRRIEGIGEVIADSYWGYFDDEDNANEFMDLVKELDIIDEDVQLDNEMNGLTFCVTGSVKRFSNRRVIKELIESKGGKLTGSVSKSTNFLVTNDTSSGSAKNKAAATYGIPVLTEDEFIDKFNLDAYVR